MIVVVTIVVPPFVRVIVVVKTCVVVTVTVSRPDEVGVGEEITGGVVIEVLPVVLPVVDVPEVMLPVVEEDNELELGAIQPGLIRRALMISFVAVILCPSSRFGWQTFVRSE